METSSLLPRTMSRRGVVVSALGVGAALLLRSRPESVQPRALEDNREFPDPSFLTTPEALYQSLVVNRSNINLIDGSSLASFRSRHISGAQTGWWQDTMELNSFFFGTVLKPDDNETQGRRQRLLERWNILEGVSTVVYDDTDSESATRIAWFLRFLGIEATVLDGGLAAWLAIDGPMSSDGFVEQPGTIALATPGEDYYLVADQVVSRLSDPVYKIVDLREAYEKVSGRYQGFSIPDAAQMPRSYFHEPGAGIRDPQSLAALLSNAVINPTDHLILMAPTGVDARFAWVALRAMGATNVTICDGGWQEWVTRPGVPLQSLANSSPDGANHSAQ